MLLKWCTQNVSKSGKLSSGHRTGKGEFSFQSPRRAMPKNVQTTIQLRTFHMLAKLCSKSFKIGFSSTPENFEMYQLGLEKAEKPEIKVTTKFVGSQRKQGNSRKTSISALLTMWKSLTVWITTNCGKFLEMGIPDHLTWLLGNPCMGQEATVRTGHGTTDWFQIGKGVPRIAIPWVQWRAADHR